MRGGYKSKEECIVDMSGWVWEREDEYIESRLYTYRKPEPIVANNFPNIPESVEETILEMSGHKEEYERNWAKWYCDRLHHITQSLSIIGQLVGQKWDWNGKNGIFQYGREKLKEMLQRDIDRLQKLVDEL